jgi:ferritin-like metal-binding protein YciE
MSNLYTFQDLIIEQLNDLYSAETQILTVFPLINDHVASVDLREAFSNYLKNVIKHSIDLAKIFELMRVEIGETTNEAVKGMLEEAEVIMNRGENSSVKDASLISLVQRLMHYKMALYGTARTFTRHMNESQAMNLLQHALNEEAETDKILTKLAEGGLFTTGINEEACKFSLHA